MPDFFAHPASAAAHVCDAANKQRICPVIIRG